MARGRKTGRKRRRKRQQKGGDFLRSAYKNQALPFLGKLYGKLAMSMYKKVTGRKGF